MKIPGHVKRSVCARFGIFERFLPGERDDALSAADPAIPERRGECAARPAFPLQEVMPARSLVEAGLEPIEIRRRYRHGACAMRHRIPGGAFRTPRLYPRKGWPR